MKKILLIIIVLLLISGSCVNAFADIFTDMLAEQDKQLDQLCETLPSKDREQQRWLFAQQGMGIAPQKHTLDDGTISEIFPNLYYLGISSGSVDSDKLSINWSKEAYRLDNAGLVPRFSFSISGVEGINISRVSLRINGNPLDIVQCGTDVGGATQDPMHYNSDDDFYVIIHDYGVRDVNFWFEFRPNQDLSGITSLNIEYTYDYTQHLIDQRDDAVQKMTEAENKIKSNNKKKAELDAEIARLEEDIAGYKTQIAELNAQIAEQPDGLQNTGAAISEGNLIIVIVIACFAAVFLLGVIVFRKKRSGTD